MAKFSIQLKSNPHAIVLSARNVKEDEDNGLLLVYDDQGKVVGKFNQSEVASWWTVEE